MTGTLKAPVSGQSPRLKRSSAPLLSVRTIGAALLGALLMLTSPALPPWPWTLAALLLGVILCIGGNSARLAGMFLLGCAWMALRGGLAIDARLPENGRGAEYAIEGRVSGLPRSDVDRIVFDFLIDEGPVHGLSRIAWYRPTQGIEAGSRMRLQVLLRRPRGTRNPGGFDYEAHSLQRGLLAQGYLRAAPVVIGPDPMGAMDRFRERFSRRLAREVPDVRAANLLRTLVVGDQGSLAPADWDTLRRTGTTHLVAISGFHIGIVAGFAALLMGFLWRLFPMFGSRLPRRIAQAGAAVLAAVAYGLIAGTSLPVLRTVLMIATVALAAASRRNVRVEHSLALAAAAVLIFDPVGLLAPGFWLSFGGVAWLVYCLDRRQRKRPLWVVFTQAQAVMALALLPLTIWFFQQASLTGAWINLIAVPWISLVTVPLGLIALGLDQLGADGAFWHGVLELAAGSAALFWHLLDASANWPGGRWFLPRPGPVVLLLAIAGTLMLLMPRGVRGRLAGLLLLLPMILPRDAAPPAGSIEATVIDVGQGQAVLLRTQRHSLLVDTGPNFPGGLDMGEAAVLPTLRALNVRALDALLISHGDQDHDGGTPAVLTSHSPVRRLHSTPPAGFTRCRSGQRWHWDGVDFEILHPPRWFPDLGNDASCVLLASTAHGSVLVPGDISTVVEERLLRENPTLRAVDVVLVAHHGSGSSSARSWVEALSPKLALVSAGQANRFGHPRAEVVERWVEGGAQWLNTADCGAISVRVNANGDVAAPDCLRRDHPHWW